MINQDENARPSLIEIINHPWMQRDIQDCIKGECDCELKIQAKRKAILSGKVAEESGAARRGISGANIREDLNMTDIEDEVMKHYEDREITKVIDFEYEIIQSNCFKSNYSEIKIFTEFITVFQADTQAREMQGLPQQYFYELDKRAWRIKLTVR